MVVELRKKFNENFTEEKYAAFLEKLHNIYPGQLDFRVAETPIFIPKDFKNKILDACDSIVDVISNPVYYEQSKNAIPDHLKVKNQDEHPHFIAFDFGICYNANGDLEPQLIEMQAFPTLFAWQTILPEISRKHFDLPENYDVYLNDFDKQSYTELLKKIIIADENPENVILLEVFPEQQKTRIDFYSTKTLIGINTVCLTDIIKEGRELFYNNEGKKTKIKRIYNRLIFDDLFQQPKEVQEKGKLFQEDLDVVWVPHPNWFYQISKFTLPFIDHPYVPETHFLSAIDTIPEDLENYVVKPLFSFAGQGVIIDVTKDQIEAIEDPQNWIIQRKVSYAPVIQTLDEPAKAEIRMFYFWAPGAKKPVATNNLARLSKGKMVGVRYNKDKTWVGGTFCLFEK